MPPDAAPGLLEALVAATVSTGSADELLETAAEILLDRADWVVLDRLEDPDLIVRVAALDRAGPIPLAHGPGVHQRRSSASTLGLLPRVIAAPRRLLRFDRGQLEELQHDSGTYEAQQAAAMLAFGTIDVLVVALVRRDQPLGVLSLGRRGDQFSDAELKELLTVVAYLEVALDAARLQTTQSAVATAVQTYLLPPMPVVAGLRLAARYEPAASGIDVGGDWYDAFAASRGLTIVVGDAAGHDINAAATMAAARNLLRAHAVDREESPAELVARLERTAFALQVDLLGTCLVGQLEPAGDNDWRLTWSSAGHLPPIKLHDGRAELLETPADLMLGVDRHTTRSDHTTDLVPGDLVVLYTDGLIEVPGHRLTDRLELLRATVSDCGGCTPDEVCDLLVREFLDRAVDDVAILAFDVVARSAAT